MTTTRHNNNTLNGLIAQAEAAGACDEALEWARHQPDWETAVEAIRPWWAYWLRRYVSDLSA